MPENAVEIERIGHAYGTRTALEDLSLSVSSGVLFGLLGPNGGGKTTLFRILSTLLRPTRGRARVMGFDTLAEPIEVRRKLGIVFQDAALDDELTVSENLQCHGALYGLGKTHVRRRLSYLLPLLGLEDRASERVDRLSGGLKRRTDLVRGLLHSPSIILLDEPTSGLDPAARHAFWDVVDEVRRREGITVLVATHIMEEAERCDRLAIIDAGRIVATGTPDELKDGVGTETLWIESDDPAELTRRIRAHLSVAARIIGSRIQISHPNAHGLLSPLYDHHAEYIRSATVRRPNLEDVFMVHAGKGMETAEEIQ